MGVNCAVARVRFRCRRLTGLVVLTLALAWMGTVVSQECTGGIEGIEASGVCCIVECGTCGGDGCGNKEGTTDEECCTSNIESNNVTCSQTGEAPCVIDTSPTAAPTTSPPVGSPTRSPTPVPLEAPTPSPTLLPTPPPTFLPTPSPTPPTTFLPTRSPTPSPMPPTTPPTSPPIPTPTSTQEPSSPIQQTPPPTTFPPSSAPLASPEIPTPVPSVFQLPTPSPTTSLPTTFPPSSAPTVEQPSPSDPMCSNGLPGYENSVVCCPVECGQCGGSGCENILEAVEIQWHCCSDLVIIQGEPCEETDEAPCFMSEDPLLQGVSSATTTRVRGGLVGSVVLATVVATRVWWLGP